MPPTGLTLPERVNWLVSQNQKAQERLNTLEFDVMNLPVQWRADIEQARAGLIDEQRRLEREIREHRIQLRYLGVVFVVVGLILGWLGNLAATGAGEAIRALASGG